MLDEKLDKRAEAQVAMAPVPVKFHQHSIEELNRQPLILQRKN